MKPYSKDLRLKILDACDREMARKEVSRVFDVSEPTIRRYLKLRRQTGGVDPKPASGPPARKGRALGGQQSIAVRLFGRPGGAWVPRGMGFVETRVGEATRVSVAAPRATELAGVD